MKQTIETISPADAATIVRHTLDLHGNVRRPASYRVDAYKTAMLGDQWVWTDAAPLRLHRDPATDFVLCSDGLHRLAACVAADKPLTSFVIWDAPAGLNTDLGKSRSVAMWLTHRGIPRAAEVAAVARLYLVVVYGHRHKMSYSTTAWGRVTPEDVLEFGIKHHQRMWSGAVPRGATRTGFAAAHLLIDDVDAELALEFASDFTNDGLPDGDPVVALRSWLANRLRQNGHPQNTWATYVNAVKCWDQRLAGMSNRVWKPAQLTGIPVPAGWN